MAAGVVDPTGPLSALPLHAAGHHDDPSGLIRRAVLGRVVSSYTPTVRALLRARQRRPNRNGTLIVGLEETPGLAKLYHAEREATDAHRVLGGNGEPLLGTSATYDKVIKALRDAGWAHFAYHAMH